MMEFLGERGLVTVIAFAAYLSVVWWAYRAPSRARFEEDAWLPFEDEEREHLTRGGAAHAAGPPPDWAEVYGTEVEAPVDRAGVDRRGGDGRVAAWAGAKPAARDREGAR